MRKLFLILLAIPMFMACSKDDDNVNVVGTWASKSVATEIICNNDKAKAAIKADIEEFRDELTFTDGGKFSDGDGASGTYTTKGDQLSMNAYGTSATVTVNGNSFSYTQDETDYYKDKDMLKILVPNEKDVVVSKVTTTYTYTRK